MNIVKLHTTTSTNTYLKKLLQKKTVEHFTVVTTNYQTEGRGQRGNTWISDKDKNLLFSILLLHKSLLSLDSFILNQIVSLSLLKVLQHFIPDCRIKWPNDILSGSKKIAGILIENTISGSRIKHSIVGIGINVNQEKFPKELPQASSMKIISGKEFDLSSILQEIATAIQDYYLKFEAKESESIRKEYVAKLYLYQQAALFINMENKRFLGKIVGITPEGKLQIEQNKHVNSYNFKEIVFVR